MSGLQKLEAIARTTEGRTKPADRKPEGGEFEFSPIWGVTSSISALTLTSWRLVVLILIKAQGARAKWESKQADSKAAVPLTAIKAGKQSSAQVGRAGNPRAG